MNTKVFLLRNATVLRADASTGLPSSQSEKRKSDEPHGAYIYQRGRYCFPGKKSEISPVVLCEWLSMRTCRKEGITELSHLRVRG